MPRLGNPIVTLVLVLLILLGLAIKAEFALEPTPGPLEESPGAKAGLFVQQPKMGPGPDTENAPGPQQECPDAEVVYERLAKGDLQTDLFETHTDRFIVSYEVLQLQPDQEIPSLYATVEDEDERSISSGYIPSPQPGNPVRKDLRPNMGRTIVDVQPGSYRLDISPSKADRRYALLVEECGVPEVS